MKRYRKISLFAIPLFFIMIIPLVVQAPELGDEYADPQKAIEKLKQDFGSLSEEAEVTALIAQCVTCPLRKEARPAAETVTELYSGTAVSLIEVEAVSGKLWFYVSCQVGEKQYQGYIPEANIISGSREFDRWEAEAIALLKACGARREGLRSGGTGDNFEILVSVFPESYRAQLRTLHEKYPDWLFVAHLTNLKWSTVIQEEMKESRNLLEDTVITPWKSVKEGDYDPVSGKWIVKSAPNWVQASEGIVAYYIDPRNFFVDTTVFQFEALTYNESIQSLAGVNAIIKGTFMENASITNDAGKSMTYAEAFMDIGYNLNVSPYLLASRVRQEQGVKGDSPLISGTVKGYEGYYNYFNIQAYGATMDQVVTTGLNEAKKCGWTTRYKALMGGAQRISSNYIAKGQNTLYLQKFDVDSSDGTLYWRQYMQNLRAPESEGKSVKRAYDSLGITSSKFVFRIPVYVDMPQATATPTEPANPPAPPAAETPVEAKEPTAPAAPVKPENTYITEAKTASCTSAKISWAKSAGAAKYQLYRASSANGTYTLITTASGTTYTNTGLTAGKTYYYKVRAYSESGTARSYSAYSAVKSIKVTPPNTTVTKITSPAKGKIKLTWSKVSGASGYIIYRATSKSGKYTAVKTVSSGSTLSYTNTGLKSKKRYYYKIKTYRAVSGSKVKSSYSNIKYITAK